MTHFLKIWFGVSSMMVTQAGTTSAASISDIGVLAVLDLTDPELPYNQRVGLAIDKWIEAEQKCPRGDFWYNGKCHVFYFESELCDRKTEVLVLEKPKERGTKFPLKPICKNIECNSVSVWWPSLKKCVNILEAKKICGKRGKVLFDIFYDMYCECASGSGNLFEDDKCYKFYEQGPCKNDEVFKPKSEVSPTLGKCDSKVELKNEN